MSSKTSTLRRNISALSSSAQESSQYFASSSSHLDAATIESPQLLNFEASVPLDDLTTINVKSSRISSKHRGYDKPKVANNDYEESENAFYESECSNWSLTENNSKKTCCKKSAGSKNQRKNQKKTKQIQKNKKYQHESSTKYGSNKNIKQNIPIRNFGVQEILQKQQKSQNVHILGGLIMSQNQSAEEMNNNIFNSLINKQQYWNINEQFKTNQKESSIGSDIQCTQYENNIFSDQLIIKLKYNSEPISELPNNLNISNQQKQYLINFINQQKLSRENINKLLSEEQSTNSALPLIISQRESIQNEQITNFINKNIDESSFYSFHVFSSDFNHKEVNLNKIGFSYKLLALMNFNYQSCSLFQCQELLNRLFTLEQYEQLQFQHFLSNNSQSLTQILINTFDRLQLKCIISIQKLTFEYPEHISQYFKNSNERVYFIRYHIDHSHISNILSVRAQNYNILQLSSPQSTNSYSTISQNFIQKFYSEELKIQQEIELIKYDDEAQEKTINTYLSQNLIESFQNLTQQSSKIQKQNLSQLPQNRCKSEFQDSINLYLQKGQSQQILEQLCQTRNQSWSISTKASDSQEDIIKQKQEEDDQRTNNEESEDDDDDEDDDESLGDLEDEEDIDILLLKIQLIQKFKQQMNILQQQQQQQQYQQQQNSQYQKQCQNNNNSSYQCQNQMQIEYTQIIQQKEYQNNNNQIINSSECIDHEMYLNKYALSQQDVDSDFSSVKKYPSFIDF
ncbi:hypothetical protein ABPG72_018524 [Tetrahymena utriculariae]